MRALISGVELGATRMGEIVEKYGVEGFDTLCGKLLDTSERRMRAEIRDIPDGCYRFRDAMDNDGVSDDAVEICVAIHVQGDEIVADFHGSSPQVAGPINATLGVTWSACYNAFLHLTDPSIPKNSGCFRPIRVLAPAGTVVNVDYPAPEVGGNTETHPRIAGAVIGAMAQAIPDRVMAAEGGTHLNFVFGGRDPRHDEYFACYDIELVGWGARAFADGNDATDSINGNCRVIPVEVFETRYPWLTEEYRLLPDSGGAGRFRGGLGTQKTWRCRGEEIVCSQLTDRHDHKPWGLSGGREGRPGATHIQLNDDDEWQTMSAAFGKASSSKWSNVRVREGNRIRLATPGGGGYGEPSERDASRLEEDLAEGYVTEGAARRDYGPAE